MQNMEFKKVRELMKSYWLDRSEEMKHKRKQKYVIFGIKSFMLPKCSDVNATHNGE